MIDFRSLLADLCFHFLFLIIVLRKTQYNYDHLCTLRVHLCINFRRFICFLPFFFSDSIFYSGVPGKNNQPASVGRFFMIRYVVVFPPRRFLLFYENNRSTCVSYRIRVRNRGTTNKRRKMPVFSSTTKARERNILYFQK